MDLGRDVDGIDYIKVDPNGLKYPKEIMDDNEKEFRALIERSKNEGTIDEEAYKEYLDILNAVSEWNNDYFTELEFLLNESIQEDVERDEILEWEVNK